MPDGGAESPHNDNADTRSVAAGFAAVRECRAEMKCNNLQFESHDGKGFRADSEEQHST